MGLLDDAIREHLDLKRRRGADPTEVERAEREALGPVRRAPVAHAEPEFDERLPAHPDLEPDEEWDAPAAMLPPDAPPTEGTGEEYEPSRYERAREPADELEPRGIEFEPAADAVEPPPARIEPEPPPRSGRGFFRRRSARPPEPEPEPRSVRRLPREPEPPLEDDLDPWTDEDELDDPRGGYTVEPAVDPADAPPARPLASRPVTESSDPPPPVPATPPADPQPSAAPPPAAEAPPPASPHPAADQPPRPAPRDELLGETVEYDVEQAFQEDEDVLEETPEFLQDTPDHDRLWFEQRPPKDFDFDG